MTRTTLIAAFVAFTSIATAAPARTLDGQRIDTDDYVTVSWSMEDPDSVAALQAVSMRRGVLAVNTDSAQDRSRLVPFLRARNIQLPVVNDPGARLPISVEAAAGVEVVQVAVGQRFGGPEIDLSLAWSGQGPVGTEE